MRSAFNAKRTVFGCLETEGSAYVLVRHPHRLRLGNKTDGTAVFEERIVVFEAASWDEVHAKARAEADGYAKTLGFTAHPDQVGYEQDGDRLIDGYEVWSELFEARTSLEDFYESRYSRFDYHPE